MVLSWKMGEYASRSYLQLLINWKSVKWQQFFWDYLTLYDLQPGTQQHNIIPAFKFPILILLPSSFSVVIISTANRGVWNNHSCMLWPLHLMMATKGPRLYHHACQAHLAWCRAPVLAVWTPSYPVQAEAENCMANRANLPTAATVSSNFSNE